MTAKPGFSDVDVDVNVDVGCNVNENVCVKCVCLQEHGVGLRPTRRVKFADIAVERKRGRERERGCRRRLETKASHSTALSAN